MRKHFVLFIALAVCTAVLAQPRFVPDQEIRKMGEVLFMQPRKVVFGFSNKGNAPLVISRVHPSCGCTSVEYTKTEIPAGGRGEIRATYDAGLLGSFVKYLEVYTNASDNPVLLSMHGRVVASATDFTGDFPIDLGNVRMSTNYVEFDNVNMGDRPVAEIQIVNTERVAYRPQLMHLPEYLSAEYMPEVLPGGRSGRIRLTLDSGKLPMMGLNRTSVYLARYMGDKVSDQNELQVAAVLLPAFSQMDSTQLALAPVMRLSSTDVHVSPDENGRSMTQTVMITNEGKSTLTIQHVQVFNRAVGVGLSDRTIAPGKSAKLKIKVTPSLLKKERARPRVLLVSNDPHHAAETVNIIVNR